uniref:Pyrin domain-containing protein n=1 Tax=Neogobius melanostomus TaxID=47308 RepID=A0A8C6SKE5_9GOBI
MGLSLWLNISLDNLDFQRFKLYLRDRTLLKEFEVIKRNRLETDDRTKILQAMMDNYGIFTLRVMKRVLMELGLGYIQQKLSEYPYDPEGKTDLRTVAAYLRYL